MEYLKNGNLPDEEKVARELTLNKKQYVLMDDILVSDGTYPQGRTELVLSRRLIMENLVDICMMQNSLDKLVNPSGSLVCAKR